MSDDNSLSNVEARLNVYHVSRSRESIQAGMTWAELHQYLQLFWANQRSKILSELTPSQRSERRRISFQRRTLPDSFLEVCDSHKLLLLPENMLDSKDSDIEMWNYWVLRLQSRRKPIRTSVNRFQALIGRAASLSTAPGQWTCSIVSIFVLS